MGLFNDIFGGGSSSSKPANVGRRSGELLLENFFPGIQTGSQRGGGESEGTSGLLKSYFDTLGTPINSALGGTAYANGKPTALSGGGYGISTAGGRVVNNNGAAPVGNTLTGGGGGSLLPSIAEIGNYRTLFDKFDAGGLPPSANGIISRSLEIINTPINTSSASIIRGIQSFGGNVVSIPDPPGIGEITVQIINDLPPNIKGFIDNVFAGGTKDSIEAEVNNLAEKLEIEAAADAESLGKQLLDTFEANGITGGAARAGLKQVAVQTAIRTNAEIARTRIGALAELNKRVDQGINLLNSLTAAGEAEQRNIVSQNIAQYQGQVAIQTAKINAATQIQAQLIGLQATQIQFTGNLLGLLVGESNAQESARISANRLPYEVLLGLATGSGTVQKQNQTGGALAGIGNIFNVTGTVGL